MEANRLDSFQREVLSAFFARETHFFLTGGAALAGYYLRHRTTKDLDLFTTEDRIEDGVRALTETAREIGASIEALRTAPDFRRFLLRRREESVVVDLVRELVPQAFPDKTLIDAIRVDLPEEILANKLCTLLARAEIRDLVDIWALEKHGYSIASALPRAANKDAGLSPAQLAWVLSEIQIGEDAIPPGDLTADELREYLDDLQRRLTLLAYPASPGRP